GQRAAAGVIFCRSLKVTKTAHKWLNNGVIVLPNAANDDDSSDADRNRCEQGQGAHPEGRPGDGQAFGNSRGHVPPDVRGRRWMLRVPIRSCVGPENPGWR